MTTFQPKQVDWRRNANATDFDPDDEELAQTPQDVVAVLGFDPKDNNGTDADNAVKPNEQQA